MALFLCRQVWLKQVSPILPTSAFAVSGHFLSPRAAAVLRQENRKNLKVQSDISY